MKKFHIGIIGCGGLGHVHAECIAGGLPQMAFKSIESGRPEPIAELVKRTLQEVV